MKELRDKIVGLGTVPFWGLTLGFILVWVILTGIVLGDGWAKTIADGLGGGLWGWFVINERFATDTDDRSE